jgi:hypothetical protein
MNAPLFIHLGIVRTGSSTVRRLIRDSCQITGDKCSHFPETDKEPIVDDTRYLFTEVPYPYHLSTERPCHYFTTLRDPVESVISEYFFYLEKGDIDPETSLDDYIHALPKSYNKQARWIAAINSSDPKQHRLDQPRNLFENGFFEDISDETLKSQVNEAIHNHFRFIGLLEKMDETAFLMALKFGWKRVPMMVRMNPSFRQVMYKREKPTSLQLQKIKEHNQVDAWLYQQVEAIFNQEMKEIKHALGPQLEEYRRLFNEQDKHLMQKREDLLK